MRFRHPRFQVVAFLNASAASRNRPRRKLEKPESVMCLGNVGVELYRLLESLDRFAVFLQFQIGMAEV